MEKEIDITNNEQMLAKKRYFYKKILQDCVIPEGLFEIKDRESGFYLLITDKENVIKICNLLNEQDEKIKELEKYKSKYTDCLDKQLERENATHNCLLQSKTILDNLKKENQQLKQENQQLTKLYDQLNKNYCEEMDKNIELQQSLKEKIIKELEKIKEFCQKTKQTGYCINYVPAERTKYDPALNKIVTLYDYVFNRTIEIMEGK